MKIFIRISLLALGIILGLCIVAAMKPDSFRVERSIVIDAPAEKIFPLVADLRAFTRWSPYEARDPAMQRTFSAATSGPGASYAWDGNKDVGAGRMEILSSEAPRTVVIQLDFQRPMEAHNTVVFALAPNAGGNGDGSSKGTRVSWSMEGPMPFVSKLFSIFMNFDTMVGKDFEAGLDNLKTLAENGKGGRA